MKSPYMSYIFRSKRFRLSAIACRYYEPTIGSFEVTCISETGRTFVSRNRKSYNFLFGTAITNGFRTCL